MGHYDEQREAEYASVKQNEATESFGGYTLYRSLTGGKDFITKSGAVVHIGRRSYVSGVWKRLRGIYESTRT